MTTHNLKLSNKQLEAVRVAVYTQLNILNEDQDYNDANHRSEIRSLKIVQNNILELNLNR